MVTAPSIVVTTSKYFNECLIMIKVFFLFHNKYLIHFLDSTTAATTQLNTTILSTPPTLVTSKYRSEAKIRSTNR